MRERWILLTSSLLPCEDGRSLFVVTLHGDRRQIRLQWRPKAQAEVIDDLERYLMEKFGQPD